MKWHHPAWLRAIERRLPYQIALMHSKETVYLFARFPVRRDWLIELVYDALLESAFADDTPDDTPDETLCDTHRYSLLYTLHETPDFLQVGRKQGGAGTAYEIRIDERELLRLFQAARLQGDCALVSAVLEQERFASVRKAQRKISVMYKIFVPAKRVADALNALERAGKLTSNGHLRTYGREVNEGG